MTYGSVLCCCHHAFSFVSACDSSSTALQTNCEISPTSPVTPADDVASSCEETSQTTHRGMSLAHTAPLYQTDSRSSSGTGSNDNCTASTVRGAAHEHQLQTWTNNPTLAINSEPTSGCNLDLPPCPTDAGTTPILCNSCTHTAVSTTPPPPAADLTHHVDAVQRICSTASKLVDCITKISECMCQKSVLTTSSQLRACGAVWHLLLTALSLKPRKHVLQVLSRKRH